MDFIKFGGWEDVWKRYTRVVPLHYPSNGVMLRRIVYTNPEDGVTYTYLTTDITLPAYQLVLLYKHRWDIEKIFHQAQKQDERAQILGQLLGSQAKQWDL